MRLPLLLLIIILLSSCKNKESQFPIDELYKSEIDTFFKAKMEERQGDYLQLTALHKLDNGSNTIGKSSDNNLALNIDSLPETIGTVLIGGDSLSFIASENVKVKTENDSSITMMPLQLNEYGSSIKLYHNQLSWRVITRSNEHYLRVWDAKNLALDAFKGFQHFELNNKFIFEAEFTYYETAKTEIVKAKVDGQRSTNFIGNVVFNYKNKSYTLEVGSDGFTMVGDATTGETTYGGGRYMYVNLPETNGKINLDFNKLYNPPCAFSEFTTCLYPPRQNHLQFAILAGEKLAFKE
jgi:hypothetical protein